MVDTLKFETLNRPGILQALAEKNRLFRDANTFISFALRHGGYIAGGFARILLLNEIHAKHPIKDVYDPNAYLDIFRTIDRNDNSPFKNAGKGDIDIFFPTEKVATEFLLEEITGRNFLQSTDSWVETSKLGFAREFYISEGRIRVQAITHFVAPLQEQLARFDIYNCMVAYDGTNFTYPSELLKFEEDRTLHVHAWNKWTPSRLFKYNRKHHYEHLTPATASRLYEISLEALTAMSSLSAEETDKHPIIKQFGKFYATPHGIHNKLRNFARSFSNKELLMLSALSTNSNGPLGQYDTMFSELKRRAISSP